MSNWRKTERSASTGCWFHVGNHVVKKDSFVGRFKDKAHVRVRKFKSKSKKNSAANGRLYNHLCLIHSCKTDAQRDTVRNLIVEHWLKDMNEEEATALFIKSYGQSPFLNWNYSCTGEVGVYPTNCPSESYNHHVMKGKNIRNLSLTVYLVEKMPAMLTEEATLRSDPCSIEIPTKCSHLCLVVNACYKSGRDALCVRQDDNGIGKEWLIAVGDRVGHQITSMDKRLLACAEEGVAEPFRKLLENGMTKANVQESLRSEPLSAPSAVLTSAIAVDTTKGRTKVTVADVASSMVRMTSGYCFVRIRLDGLVVGDCQDCIKHLGYNCPAVNYIRSKCGQLDGGINALENGVKVILNRRGKLRQTQRNTTNMYEGGLCSRMSLKDKEAAKFQRDMFEFMESLSDDQAFQACRHLKLDQWCYLPEEDVKGNDCIIDRDMCVNLLQTFFLDPVVFRQKQSEAKSKLGARGKAMFPATELSS